MKKKVLGVLLALCLCLPVLLMIPVSAEAAGRTSGIEEQLRAIENQYNSGIAPMSFVQGFIPWDEYFTVSGLSEDLTAGWLNDCKKVSPKGYNVDNTGVKGEKFPTFPNFPKYDGYKFDNVTINDVEVVRAGILMPDDDANGKPVYYYMTPEYLDSDQGGTSGGGHTGAISALLLPEGQKFQVNYSVKEFELSYKVIENGQDVTSDAWLKTVFGGSNPATTTNRAASFDISIPYGYTAKVYRVYDDGRREQLIGEGSENEDINEGYDLGTEPKYGTVAGKVAHVGGPSAMRMNATLYDPNVTENRTIVVELTDREQAPLFYANYWIATANAGTRATSGTNTSGAGANILPDDDNKYNWRNSILAKNPEDAGVQNDAMYQTYWKKKDGDDTYTLRWIFQTNTEDEFVLDSLELNNVYIPIPLKPLYEWNNGDVETGADESDYKKKVTLPDGAVASLTYYRHFNTGKKPQRVYIVDVTGARSNVTVTNGNLMMYGEGAAEYIASILSGVTGDDNGASTFGYYSKDTNDWDVWRMSVPQVKNQGNDTDFDGDPDHYGANIRFKLQEGYENPFYTWVDGRDGTELETSRVLVKDPNKPNDPGSYKNQIIPWNEASSNLENRNLKPNYIYGPTDDGYYYIRIAPQDTTDHHKMCILNINATAMKYMVRYMVGSYDEDTNAPADEDVENMPSFDTDDSAWDDNLLVEGGIKGQHLERYDDNYGNFYDLQNYPTIAVTDTQPTNKEKFFRYWVVVDKEEKVIKKNDKPIIVRPNEVLKLDEYLDWAVALSQEIGDTDYNYYVIRLKAVWSDVPITSFEFYIRMVWTDEETGETHMMTMVQNVQTSTSDPNMTDDGCLIVTVNTVTDTFKNWFEAHPFYAYAARNFISTAERPDDMLSGTIWEAYPESFTIGSAEAGIINPDAHYRIEKGKNGIVRYIVQRGGTIVLYLDQVNGTLPVTKTVQAAQTGSSLDPDEEFTYTVTARLLPEDIARASLQQGQAGYLTKESLRNMLPSGTYFGFAPNPALNGFTGKDVTLQFTRDAELNGNMEDWYSVATFTLKGGEATVLGLPQGSYTVVEAKGEQNFNFDVSVNGKLSAERSGVQTVKIGQATAAMPFVNYEKGAVLPGNLTVSKQVTGTGGDAEEEFDFTLTVSDTTLNGTLGDMEFVNGVAEFTLKHGESKTAAGLPAGATYTVVEQSANQNGYTTTATGDTGVIVENGSATAVFENARDMEAPIPPQQVGGLTVTKQVVGDQGDISKAFSFAVKLSDSSINGTYGDMEFVGGTAVFTLKHGESKTATGLPAGVSYTVTESGNEGYITSSTNATGTIPEEGTIEVTFVNARGTGSGVPTGNVPPTGDSSHPTLWLCMMLIGAAGLLLRRRARR